MLSFCDGKTDHQKFSVNLVQNSLEINVRKPHPQSTQRGRPNPQDSQIYCLEGQHIDHCPAAGLSLWCCMCTAKRKRMTTEYMCLNCKFSLCSDQCFHRLNQNSITGWEGKHFQKCKCYTLRFIYTILFYFRNL
jgi:hypothetical protein